MPLGSMPTALMTSTSPIYNRHDPELDSFIICNAGKHMHPFFAQVFVEINIVYYEFSITYCQAAVNTSESNGL
jgi:hypothetical protein